MGGWWWWRVLDLPAPALADSRSPAARPPPSASARTSTGRPSSTAAATTRACAPSAACACPFSTRRPAWPRTTATSGWRRPTAGLVPAARLGRGGACVPGPHAHCRPPSLSLHPSLSSRSGPRTDLHLPRPLLEEETETQHPGGPQAAALRVQDRWVELWPLRPLWPPSKSSAPLLSARM